MSPTYYRPQQPSPRYADKKPKRRGFKGFFFLVLVLAVMAAGLYTVRQISQKAAGGNAMTTAASPTTGSATQATQTGSASTSVNHCAGNNLSQLVLVSVSDQHVWACSYTTTEFSSPAVTGINYLPADLTPPGTYHVYAKATDQYLKGCDSTGCWNDYVNYWMPFLFNQYGAYGFHDATWRPVNAFGMISPNSPDGSHGCVELPLATAAWLYKWVNVGTTVTVVA